MSAVVDVAIEFVHQIKSVSINRELLLVYAKKVMSSLTEHVKVIDGEMRCCRC